MIDRSSGIKLVAVLILMVLSISTLTSVFDRVSIDVSDAQIDLSLDSDTGSAMSKGDLVVDLALPEKTDLFTINGYPGANYIQTGAFTTYRNGKWIPAGEYQEYDGLPLHSESNSDLTSIIIPLTTFNGLLPVAKGTYLIAWQGSSALEYCPEFGTFRLSGGSLTSLDYFMKISKQAPTVQQLAQPTPAMDAGYYQVPESLRAELTELATMITVDATTPLEKVNALVEYLKEHYVYTFQSPEAPEGKDTVEWFLFTSHAGVCTHFNTALILMARCLGLPARMCSGYLIQDLGYQVVDSSQAHAYAEVAIGSAGWIIFDATPSTTPVIDIETGEGLSEDPGVVDKPDGTITGTVWWDSSKDKVLNNGERPLPNRTVVLRDEVNNIIVANLTDVNGKYVLHYPEARGYTVDILIDETELALPQRSVPVDTSTATAIVVNFAMSSERVYAGQVATYTNITRTRASWDDQRDFVGSLSKAQSFVVEGTVTTDTGIAEGANVMIYLSKTKTLENAYLVGGSAPVLADGTFHTSCMAPANLPAGSYQLIARTTPDINYMSSISDPEVQFSDNTSLRMNGPTGLVMGIEATFTFSVLETSGVVVPNVNITVEMFGHHVIKAGPSGRATLTVVPDVTGPVDIHASYAGCAYLSGANLTATVQSYPPSLEIVGFTLTRGENASIMGRALGGSVPVAGKEVTITLTDVEGKDLIGPKMTAITGPDGFFALPFQTPLNASLGLCTGTASLEALCTAPLSAQLAARSFLNITAGDGGIVVQLKDDLGQGLSGKTIWVNTSFANASYATGPDGVIAVGIEKMTNTTVIFDGDGAYLPAQLSFRYMGGGAVDWSRLMYLPMFMAVLAAVLLVRWAWTLARARRAARSLPTNDGPYPLSSPQMSGEMPLVWAENAPPLVQVKGDGEEVTVTAGATTRTVRTGELFTLDLARGEHVVEVRGHRGRTLALVRVVDYRDEVARLFQETSRNLEPSIGGRCDLSPREIASALRAKVGDAPELEALVDMFERAKYSTHEITKEEYESMYRACRSVSR